VIQPFQVAPGQIYQREILVRDDKYRRYVKQFPCVGCRRTWMIDPAHCGPHGTGQKASDLTCIPLCRKCHREFDANPVKFVESRRLDIPALQRMFQRFYCLKHGNPSHWPTLPDLTLQTCPNCQHEQFTEEMWIAGCSQCGAGRKEAA
jgi:hypothetical protein